MSEAKKLTCKVDGKDVAGVEVEILRGYWPTCDVPADWPKRPNSDEPTEFKLEEGAVFVLPTDEAMDLMESGVVKRVKRARA